MNEQEFEEWGKNVDKVFYAQIFLNKLKKRKKITNKQYKEIKIKIKKLRYKTFLNSPHFEGNEELRKNALKLCFQDYCSFMGITK